MINNEHNIIIANRNPELDNFGTLYGLQMDNSDEVIYESSSLEEPITFTIDIEINDSTRKEFIAEIDKKDPISFSSKKESLSTEENIITLLQAIVSTIEFQFG